MSTILGEMEQKRNENAELLDYIQMTYDIIKEDEDIDSIIPYAMGYHGHDKKFLKKLLSVLEGVRDLRS